ncbi:MAG TPA: NAD-dependent epimerase/dehydratase family protein [Kofleriaceae bacterium]|nr:NAD-dependent epimerase/dehydratase family protein [Kofleriaceae bacterium]
MQGATPMSRRALITGGAGFIGSHLADELLQGGYRVRALDVLLPQVHGAERLRPSYLAADVELIQGDLRDPAAVRRALADVDVVYHLAARVGVGQSMYEIAEYTAVNNLGTATLLEALIERLIERPAERPIERLIVASSMSIYGEGLYRDDTGRTYDQVSRSQEQLVAGHWEPRSPEGRSLDPVPTPETKAPGIASVYALSKWDQERLCLMTGAAYRIPTVALRFFNVYGPRQALSNPYTGVLAIFAARLLNGNAPLVFEDGRQQRDFVHVRDVARACRLALEVPEAAGGVFNIGSGRALAIHEVAERMAEVLGSDREPQITYQYRVGDIRHCTAAIERARHILGYEPSIDFDRGLAELAGWLASQRPIDRVDTMRAELSQRGLAL